MVSIALNLTIMHLNILNINPLSIIHFDTLKHKFSGV